MRQVQQHRRVKKLGAFFNHNVSIRALKKGGSFLVAARAVISVFIASLACSMASAKPASGRTGSALGRAASCA